MKLSVIIVNYNVTYFLEQALLSVLKAAKNVSTEIIVVDNNSVDNSCAMVKEKFPSVTLIENKENRGFSFANNQGIQISKGEYVLLLNPDTVVEEDTFSSCLKFMDEHPKAGGLGVKMIDGAGNFLPESKRGLPTPAVAFYKIFGLSALFPKSRIFGKYHLGYLDKEKTHEVEILAGAFMLLRKSVLDKIGLLDEAFFMYGEDIDLSYRIIKAGYKNYYFPGTRIIHYKGESTRKSSINYVFVFYNAMVIFAQKHFSQRHASLFSFLIHCAIYLRAGIAIAMRFAKKIFLPLLDSLLLFSGLFLLKLFWESNVKGAEGIHYYPAEYIKQVVPLYIIVWLISIYFSGGYDRPVRVFRVLRGILAGSVFILVVYALLPESMRYSRALILLGTVWASAALPAMRFIFSLSGWKEFSPAADRKKKIIIIGDKSEAERVRTLLTSSSVQASILGFVKPADADSNGSSVNSDFSVSDFLGGINHLTEIMEVYRPDELIFCSKNISASIIIDLMSKVKNNKIEYKIAPPESSFIIGSNSVENPGDLYLIDINSITKPVNKRNKRMFDFCFSIALLIASPLLFLLMKSPFGFARNIILVLAGKRTWVGYIPPSSNLPKIKKGILAPADALKISIDNNTAFRLNSMYARDYKIYKDLAIVSKAWKELGRS